MVFTRAEFSRRGILGAAVAGTALVGTAGRAGAATRAAVPREPESSEVVTSSLAELEAYALTLEPPVFLLETEVPEQIRAMDRSGLSIHRGVGRVGENSLRWDHGPASVLQVRAPIVYRAGLDTMAFWMYQSRPSSGKLRLEFGRGAGTDAWCEINLQFTGWRTAWIRYKHDLQGRPHQGMNTVRFVAPDEPGTLHLDQLILNTPLREDWPTPDRQVPFVQPDVSVQDNRHWLDLLRFSQLEAAPLATPEPSTDELADLATVVDRYNTAVRKQVSVTTSVVDDLAASVDSYGVPVSGARGGGRPVDGYQSAIYPAAIAEDLARLAPVTPLRKYCDLMFGIASAYDSTSDPALRGRTADLYLRMLEHLTDQGWTDGSCQGTIHHLGYQARGLYSSVWLMRGLLEERGLLAVTRTSLAWLQGLGRLRLDWSDAMPFGGIFDILNTTFTGMLGTVLMADGAPRKVAQLRLLQAWLDHAVSYSPGIEDGFKKDLSTFHHVGHYPDYARDGYKGASPSLAVLSRTTFAFSRSSHELWNEGLLRQRFYANKEQWPIGQAARHPTGVTALSVNPFKDMTVCGSPDGQHALDPAVGAAFIRLARPKPTTAEKTVIRALDAQGVEEEPAPNGCVAMNHAASLFHRRGEWLVALRGHNRYVWSTEIYPGNNVYGRYVSYGQIQVLSGGDPVTNRDSGFLQPGWDWSRWPGTTAIRLPYDLLAADFSRSGEEMLLTDSRIGGGGTLDGRHGAFLIDLHEHPKYDESHRARKSVFLFDERVVALGSGIVNSDGDHRTETTLFQGYLADPSAPQYDSALGTVASVPYRADRELSEPIWMVDPQHVGYYVPGGQRLVLARGVQTAPDQSGTKEGSQQFSTAWLDHGAAPQGESYEYAMVVGATAETMAGFAAQMSNPAQAPYAVLRRDEVAHLVRDRATGILAHAVFAPTDQLTDDAVLRSVDSACVVLLRPEGQGIRVSVTDPDLHLYEGEDPEQYDEQGHFVGDATPYSRPWRRSPGRASTIVLRVAGRWACDAPRVTARPDGRATELAVTCSDGLATEFTLSPLA